MFVHKPSTMLSKAVSYRYLFIFTLRASRTRWLEGSVMTIGKIHNVADEIQYIFFYSIKHPKRVFWHLVRIFEYKPLKIGYIIIVSIFLDIDEIEPVIKVLKVVLLIPYSNKKIILRKIMLMSRFENWLWKWKIAIFDSP